MEQKPAEEFVGLERHHFHAVVIRVVLPAEPDATVVVIDESIIRQRDTVGVSPKIGKDMLW